jgi:hypothetical protein
MTVKSLEDRVRTLENWAWAGRGALALLALVATALLGVVTVEVFRLSHTMGELEATSRGQAKTVETLTTQHATDLTDLRTRLARLEDRPWQRPAVGATIFQGSLIRIGRSEVVVKDEDGLHTYKLAPGVSIGRDGRKIRPQDLQEGAAVEYRLDQEGRVVRIDTWSPGKGPTRYTP